VPNEVRNSPVQVFDVLRGEAAAYRPTPFGGVGTVLKDANLECVWVSKHHEQVDPDWFSSDVIDLIVMVQGELRVEFDSVDEPARVLSAGQVLVLPPKTRCRAYSWPRDSDKATIFVAVYPARWAR
jgi:hypothetical protein